ncbi:barstar family protein [Aliiglaciecola sp. LCG003]|jgi:ribonuclease inhibitor|uniref:barstar family protein n=1 Tax=Aliiglaciecola sp. LCG003 TaxID=3053655 RepID=UPI0025722E7F|nr:barstar family protein [Aliiglaciecola sp. LCG003]WJG07962.1 barstar family protein [Aliiglaciecola sp. LCG003]
MTNIIIDGKDFKNEQEFHKLIKIKMDFPDYYGENLDALWDCLTSEIEQPISITWVNFKDSLELLGDDAVNIASTFEDASSELPNFEFSKL